MLQVGKTVSFGKTISESDVYRFARIIGHFNSININPIKAKTYLVYGLYLAFCAGGISTAIGIYLLAPDTIYKSQPTTFKRLVKIEILSPLQ